GRVPGDLRVGAAGVERLLLVELGRRPGVLGGGRRGLRFLLGGVEELLVGRARLPAGRLGGRLCLHVGLHVEHLRRLDVDRLALVEVGVGVGDLVLGCGLLVGDRRRGWRELLVGEGRRGLVRRRRQGVVRGRRGSFVSRRRQRLVGLRRELLVGRRRQ